MGDSSSKDLVYRIISTADGDGFIRTATEAEQAKLKLEEASRAADEVSGKRVSVKTDTDAEDTGQKLENAGKDADKAGQDAANSGGGWGGLATKISLITVGVGVLAPALAALPAALAGAGAAGGVLALGFGGITSAVRDYGQASGAAGVSSAQMAQTAYSNALALRNAQEQITQARTAATQQEATSANQLISAQEALQNAEQSATQTELALTQARQDASRSLVQANEAAATASLDVQAAQIAVTEAQQQQIQTDNSLTATALDREKAALAVAQAQNNLKDVTTRAQQAQQDADTANQKGVEGSPQVVAAKQSEAKAAQGVSDAQRSLAQTQRQAADSQAASAQQIAKAVQNLADTQKQQALAAAASAQQAGAAFNQFGKDMAKLTPVGQEIVRTILGMRGELDMLKATSQNAIGPGVLSFLGGVQAMGPTANTALQQMGTAIGGVLTQLGKLMQSPAFQQSIGLVFKEAAGFVGQFGAGFTQMVSGVVTAGAQAAPIVTGLGSGLQQILGVGLPALFSGLASGGSGAGEALSSLGGILSDLMGPLGQLVGALSSALGPVLAALRPVISQLAGSLLTALLPVIRDLSPILVVIAQLLEALMPIVGPLIQIVGMLADSLLKALLPALQPLIPVIQQAATVIGAQLLTSFQQLMPSFIQLIQSSVQFLPALTPLIPPLAQLVVVLLQLATPIAKITMLMQTLTNDAMRPAQMAMSDLAQFAIPYLMGPLNSLVKPFEAIGDAAKTGVDWAEKRIGDLTGWISGLAPKFASAGAHTWDWIRDTFKSAINTVIGWWNGIHFTLPKVSTPLGDIGGGSVGVPTIPYLATGGDVVGSGLAVVGEAGPELVRLGAPAQVISNRDSRALLGAGGQAPDRFVAELNLKLNGQQMDKVFVEFQRQGGTVQSMRTAALAAIGTGGR